MFQSRVPHKLWVEAFLTAVYLKKLVSSSVLPEHKSSYGILMGKVPIYTFLRGFLCSCYFDPTVKTNLIQRVFIVSSLVIVRNTKGIDVFTHRLEEFTLADMCCLKIAISLIKRNISLFYIFWICRCSLLGRQNMKRIILLFSRLLFQKRKFLELNNHNHNFKLQQAQCLLRPLVLSFLKKTFHPYPPLQHHRFLLFNTFFNQNLCTLWSQEQRMEYGSLSNKLSNNTNLCRFDPFCFLPRSRRVLGYLIAGWFMCYTYYFYQFVKLIRLTHEVTGYKKF